MAGAAWWLSTAKRTPLAGAGAAEAGFLRPAGSVLGPFGVDPRCPAVDYAGAETRLYADRPYHTAEPVPVLVGLRFCRGDRHGRALWILDVERATHLYALASARHDLERAGWRLYPQPVLVEAEGLALDRLYRLRVEPGRYAIHYGHATTANPVFWNPRDARIAPVPPAGG